MTKHLARMATFSVVFWCGLFTCAAMAQNTCQENALDEKYGWVTERFVFPDRLSDVPSYTPVNRALTRDFAFRGANICANSQAVMDTFRSQIKKLADKQVNDAKIVQFIGDVRQHLEKQNFTNIQITYHAAQVQNGIVPLALRAQTFQKTSNKSSPQTYALEKLASLPKKIKTVAIAQPQLTIIPPENISPETPDDNGDMAVKPDKKKPATFVFKNLTLLDTPQTRLAVQQVDTSVGNITTKPKPRKSKTVETMPLVKIHQPTVKQRQSADAPKKQSPIGAQEEIMANPVEEDATLKARIARELLAFAPQLEGDSRLDAVSHHLSNRAQQELKNHSQEAVDTWLHREVFGLLFNATVWDGSDAYGKPSKITNNSTFIGIFNSQRTAQLFFESLPLYFQEKVDYAQFWLNVHKGYSGFTEHYLEIEGLTDYDSEEICSYVRGKDKDTQCIVVQREQLNPLEKREIFAEAIPKTEDSKFKSFELSKVLDQLHNRQKDGDLNNVLDLSPPPKTPAGSFEHRKNIKPYGENFVLDQQPLDTPEAQAAKAAYDLARDRFVKTLRSVGEGINAGNGDEAAREQLLALGRESFEAAGSAYLSGFLDQELGQTAILSSDAGSGATFVHHVKKNLGDSTQNTVEGIVSDFVSSITGQSGSYNLAGVTDEFMLAGARGLIDAGLATARRSDLYALRNMELEYNINDFKNSYLSALVTQPVYQSVDLRHNVFLQGGGILNERSIDIDDDVSRHTLNIGAAYRYLTEDEKYLLGGNVFFDHQWPYNHSRMSVGADAKAENLNLAANYYIPLTDYRNSRTGENGNEFQERALEGYDIELGYTLPFLPELSVFGKGYQYFRDADDDIRGLELSGEYNVRDNLTLRGAMVEENGGRDGIEIAVQYRIPLYDTGKPNLARETMKSDVNSVSMRGKIFEKVRRENRIRVEERLKGTAITAQFGAFSVGLPFDVGGSLTGTGVDLPFNTAITVPNGDFGIIEFSNGAIANVSASGGGDVILEFNATTLTVTATNGGFVQFISGNGGGISVVNVPGGTVNLLGTDIDVTDDGTTTSVQVRAGQIEVVPTVGAASLIGNQGEVITLNISTGATATLVNPALETRQEAAYTNLDLVNPDPPTSNNSAPFINVAPALISGPQFVGNNADLRLTFTQAVTVSGSPFINAFIDANARTFTYNAAASTANQLVFRHIYVAGDVGAAAITINDLDLNGGTITGTTNTLNSITAFTPNVVPITDQTLPMLIGSTPADNEPAFSAADDIVLNFDENVQANIGNIILTDTTDGSDNRIIPIGDAQVSIAGSTLTINPTGILDLATGYDLVIGTNVIQDTSGNAFAGISSGELNFTTSNDITPPTFNPATDSSPADNDVDVLPDENIVITFSEAVNKNVGNIEIRRSADNVLLETIDVTTGLVTGGGTNIITINPANDYPIATEVYVLIDAGAFEDMSGNQYAGIASTTAFNFRRFSPIDLASLAVWLDGNDLDGDGAPEGASENGITAGAIATWVDKSGNGVNVLQGAAGNRPAFVASGINGLPVARFDGTNDSLNSAVTSIASANGHTVFVVADINNSISNSTIVRHRPNGSLGTLPGISFELDSSENYGIVFHEDVAGNALRNDSTGSSAPVAAAILGVDFATSGLAIYHDGVVFDNTISSQTGAPPLGNVDGNTAFAVGNNFDSNDRPLAGDISEILVFTESLSNADRQLIERYLGEKYNIVVP